MPFGIRRFFNYDADGDIISLFVDNLLGQDSHL